ncbi:MAG: hypothetical protein HQK55_13175, partial [Deltaproteobacteria bacterium]|nr:hypothetical protein [Deltaproteobacteria bacterium]
KKKKKGRWCLADQGQLGGYIFLRPISRLGVGGQTIHEALTSEERFIPFETTEGEYSFINQTRIVWVTMPLDEADSEGGYSSDSRSVRVFLQDGKMFGGHIIIATPEGKSRLSDQLNEIKDFMILRDSNRLVLININFVVRVV